MGNVLVKLYTKLPNHALSKFVALNGAIDIILGLNTLLINPNAIIAVNKSLSLPATSPYAKRSTAWLIFTIGLMRIIGYWYPTELASQVSAYWSYFVEATWMLSETLLHGTTANLTTSIVLYLLGFIVRGKMKRQIKAEKKLAAVMGSSGSGSTATTKPRILPTKQVRRIIFVRHGESEYNLACTDAKGNQHMSPQGGPNGTMSKDHKDYLDSGLTSTGIKQAQSIQDHVMKLNPELAVSSSMRRALQTATYAMKKVSDDVPIVCSEHVREMMFKPAWYTKRDLLSKHKKQFPHVDFSAIEDEEDSMFNNIDGTRERSDDVVVRIAKFMKWLSRRKEKTIVVFCHGFFIRILFTEEKMKKLFEMNNINVADLSIKHDLKNCAMQELTLEFSNGSNNDVKDGNSTSNNSNNSLKTGDRVSAKAIGWKNHYAGEIIAINEKKNGLIVYDIKFDDGETQKNVKYSQIKTLTNLKVGDDIQCKAIGWKKYYKGTIIKVQTKGNGIILYDLKFEDGDIQRKVGVKQLKF